MRYSSEAASAIAVTADGHLLAWATTDSGVATIHFRDLRNGHETLAAVPPASASSNSSWWISTLSFSADGHHLAASISTPTGDVVETLDDIPSGSLQDHTQFPPLHFVGPRTEGPGWSSAIYRGSSDQLVAVATTPQGALPTQLVVIDPATGDEAGPLLPPATANPFMAAPTVQLASDATGTVLAFVPSLCGVCQGGGGGWGLFRIDKASRTLATGSNLPVQPQGGTGPPEAIAWLP